MALLTLALVQDIIFRFPLFSILNPAMELIRGIHNLQPCHHGCVITIGNFDGFHRGHQALIAELQTEGHRRGLPVMVMIFEPQPQEYFSGYAAPARLTRLRDKVKYLAATGVDSVICVTFDKWFASLSAGAFITNILVQKLGIRFISIGDDFRFGARRRGDYTLLYQVGKVAGFEVKSTITYTEDGQRISSTAVREALAQDHLLEAERLLGHPYRLSGRVIHGDELGRTIGFPTANLSLKGLHSPINGVYAVEVYGIEGWPLPGIMSIGTRPTVSGFCQSLEVHLLGIDIDLYGRHIEVVIREKVRNEQRFDSLNHLRQQIASDVMSAHNYFGLVPP